MQDDPTAVAADHGLDDAARTATDAGGLPRLRLGLSLAGGISAGCYSAGVLDFLVEALDAWHEARDRGDAEAPAHAVLLEAVAGSSAGAETAALLAPVLRSRFPHVRLAPGQPEPAHAADNPLYMGWVHGATAADLLGSRDWSDGAFRSLLDGTRTDEVIADALATLARLQPQARAWLAEPLRMGFTINHLPGVPLAREPCGPTGPAEGFRLHADVVRFALAGVGAVPAQAPLHHEQVLNFPSVAAQLPGALAPLMQAAAASGALPVLLPERLLKQPLSAYQPLPVPLPAGVPLQAAVPFEALWRPGPVQTVRVVAGDGGLLVGNPVDTVRAQLAPGGGNRLLLSVNPMLAPAEPEAAPDALLFGARPLALVRALARALLNHAQLAPGFAALERQPGPVKHALIAPARVGAPDEPTSRAIASASVRGFGGYLSLAYRQHDFQLGRRNAQHALRSQLLLPADDPLFDGWTEAQRQLYRSGSAQAPMLPVMPLIGALRTQDEPVLAWPGGQDVLKDLPPLLHQRLDVVVRGLTMAYWPRCPLLRASLRLAWRLYFTGQRRRRPVEMIRKALRAHGL